MAEKFSNANGYVASGNLFKELKALKAKREKGEINKIETTGVNFDEVGETTGDKASSLDYLIEQEEVFRKLIKKTNRTNIKGNVGNQITDKLSQYQNNIDIIVKENGETADSVKNAYDKLVSIVNEWRS